MGDILRVEVMLWQPLLVGGGIVDVFLEGSGASGALQVPGPLTCRALRPWGLSVRGGAEGGTLKRRTMVGGSPGTGRSVL